jgi:hypothetical protein
MKMKLNIGRYGWGVVRRLTLVVFGLAVLVATGVWRYHFHLASAEALAKRYEECTQQYFYLFHDAPDWCVVNMTKVWALTAVDVVVAVVLYIVLLLIVFGLYRYVRGQVSCKYQHCSCATHKQHRQAEITQVVTCIVLAVAVAVVVAIALGTAMSP